MISLGSNDEKIKNLIKQKCEKNHIIVDDLFILSLNNCKTSNLKYGLFCEELITTNQTKDLLNYYISKTTMYKISKKIYDRIATKDNTAGIIVYTEIKTLTTNQLQNMQHILICDGLEISGNIGTIFRTSEATKIDCIIFTNLKAKVFHEKVVRSSRGMIFNVPFCVMEFNELQTFLQQNHFIPVVCEPEQGVDYKNFNYKQKNAFVVGSERFGVDKKWFNNNKTQFLKIEMAGEMDSLNVGVATSLILYENFYSNK